MKKSILILTVIAVLALLVGCDMGAVEEKLERAEDRIEAALDPELPLDTSATETVITAEDAEKIALEHAGLEREQVTNIRAEYDVDDGRAEYDVTFCEGAIEYEYEIDAESGKIVSYDKDSIYD